MANATSKAQSATVPWTDDKIKRDLAATAATYYPGTMIAVNSAGYAVKCDDTAGLRFDGLMADSYRITVESTDSAGDKVVTVEKPWLFQMKIASAAITDVGRKVYALYDNEVAYSGVSNSILVGVVEAYINSTTVLVRPYWTTTSGVNAFDGETLTFTGATGANEVVIPDNLADGLTFKEGANAYLTFVTTNSGELMYASKKLRHIDSMAATFGDADDVAIAWDGTRLNVTQAATNSEIRWGVDGAGIDQIWYGDTASTSMAWDQSADALILTGAVDLQFTSTTGQSEIILTDNLADALSIKISGGNDLLVFTTTDSGELVTVPNSFAAGSNATDRVTVKGFYMSPSNVSVSVPSITDPDTARVQVDVSSAFSIQPAVGDVVVAIPQEALPSNCRLGGAWVYQTDGVEISFQSEGGNVTGASKNFKFFVIDLT